MPSSQTQLDSKKILTEKIERRRQVRGLMLLAFAAILFAIVRAGFHNVFTQGWWRLW